MRWNIYGYKQSRGLWKTYVTKLQEAFGMNQMRRKGRYDMKKESDRFCIMEISCR